MWIVLQIRRGFLGNQYNDFDSREAAEQFIVNMTTEEDVIYHTIEKHELDSMNRDKLIRYCLHAYTVIKG